MPKITLVRNPVNTSMNRLGTDALNAMSQLDHSDDVTLELETEIEATITFSWNGIQPFEGNIDDHLFKYGLKVKQI